MTLFSYPNFLCIHSHKHSLFAWNTYTENSFFGWQIFSWNLVTSIHCFVLYSYDLFPLSIQSIYLENKTLILQHFFHNLPNSQNILFFRNVTLIFLYMFIKWLISFLEYTLKSMYMWSILWFHSYKLIVYLKVIYANASFFQLRKYHH